MNRQMIVKILSDVPEDEIFSLGECDNRRDAMLRVAWAVSWGKANGYHVETEVLRTWRRWWRGYRGYKVYALKVRL